MGTRRKKDRRSANRAAKAQGQGAPQHIIFDTRDEELTVESVSQEEFEEHAKGYRQHGEPIKLPGGGGIAIIYPEDAPDANPNDPPAFDFATAPSNDHGMEVLGHLWDKLKEFAATVVEEKNLDGDAVLVGGFHIFRSTRERIEQTGADCLMPNDDALDPLVPIHWLALEEEVAINQAGAQAVEPELVAWLMADIAAAAESDDPDKALQALIEDPLRYLREVA